MNKTHLKLAAPVFLVALCLLAAQGVSAQVGAGVGVNVRADIDAKVPSVKGEFRGEVRATSSRLEMGTSSRPDNGRRDGPREGWEGKARGKMIVGTVASVGTSTVVVTDEDGVAHTLTASTTVFYAASGTSTVASADLEVGDSVRAVDAKLSANVGSKGVVGRIWGMFRSFFGGSRGDN